MFKEISDEILETFMRTVRPVVWVDWNLWYVEANNPRTSTFQWATTWKGMANNLVRHRSVESWHAHGADGFKPSIAECLAHVMPEDIKHGVVAFSCAPILDEQEFVDIVEHEGQAYFRGKTTFWCKGNGQT